MRILDRFQHRESLPEQALQEIKVARREIRQGRFQRSMSITAAFAAIVSGFEAFMQHERGAFSNRWMWTPVWLTPPMVLTAAAALFSKRAAETLLPVSSAASLVDGVIGFGLHLRGIRRMPGGFKLGQYNVVMGPPIFAPLLLSSVGVLGLLASLLRRERLQDFGLRNADFGTSPIQRAAAKFRQLLPAILTNPMMAASIRSPISDIRNLKSEIRDRKSEAGSQKSEIRNPTSAIRHLKSDVRHPTSDIRNVEQEVAQGRFQQGMALTSALFAILAGGEAYFEHLRGSYNQRFMWTPVWVTPPMFAAAIGAARSGRIARRVLPITSAITFLEGLMGFTLHLRGIKRMPGDTSNLRFNITMGPPLFAPLLFCAVGLLGLIASLLRRAD